MHIGVTVALLLATVTFAVVPAFGLLYGLYSMLPEDPHTFFGFFFCIIQTLFVWIVGFFSLFIYADIVFPFVMTIFGRVLGHSSVADDVKEKQPEPVVVDHPKAE